MWQMIKNSFLKVYKNVTRKRILEIFQCQFASHMYQIIQGHVLNMLYI